MNTIGFDQLMAEWARNGAITPPSRLAFLHVQKAAGNFVGDALGSHFPGWQVRHRDVSNPLPTAEEREKIRFVYGHIGLSDPLLAQISDPMVCVTVLREPLERMVSQYRFSGSNHENLNYNRIRSGELDFVSFARWWYQQRERQSGYFGLTETQAVTDPKACLDNLCNRVGFFGDVARLDEFLVLVGLMFGYHKLADGFRANTTEGKLRPGEDPMPVPSQEEQAEVAEIIADDIIFYRAAMQVYDARKDVLIKLLGRERVTQATELHTRIKDAQRQFQDLSIAAEPAR